MARDKSKKINTDGNNSDLKTIVEEEAEAYPSIISSFFNWLNGSQSDTKETTEEPSKKKGRTKRVLKAVRKTARRMNTKPKK